MSGMLNDSGGLYRSSLRVYLSWGCMVCKDLYVIRALRLIQNAQQTNRVSTLCAGAYVT